MVKRLNDTSLLYIAMAFDLPKGFCYAVGTLRLPGSGR